MLAATKKIFKGENIFELFALFFATSIEDIAGRQCEAMRSLNKEYLYLLWIECSKAEDFNPEEIGAVLCSVRNMVNVLMQAPLAKALS